MMILNRDAILSANDRKIEPLDIPEWGGSVFVRNMTAGERDRWEAAVQGKAVEDVRAHLATLTVCDESGALIFDPSDVPALSAKSAGALQRIFNRAVALNRISDSDVKELEKN